jgi:phage internal scaffolding protein
MSVFVRGGYNYDVDAASDEAALDCSKDSGRTQQSFEAESNINTIVARIFKTKEFPDSAPFVMQGDFVNAPDFQSAMDLIVKAREAFDAMPARVRSRFDNDPGKFVSFTSDEKNFDEAVKFGLVRPDVVAERQAKAEAASKAALDAAVAARIASAARTSGTGST